MVNTVTKLLDLLNIYTGFVTQWAKSPKKQSVGVYFLQHSTVFECRINKNALLQTVETTKYNMIQT